MFRFLVLAMVASVSLTAIPAQANHEDDEIAGAIVGGVLDMIGRAIDRNHRDDRHDRGGGHWGPGGPRGPRHPGHPRGPGHPRPRPPHGPGYPGPGYPGPGYPPDPNPYQPAQYIPLDMYTCGNGQGACDCVTPGRGYQPDFNKANNLCYEMGYSHAVNYTVANGIRGAIQCSGLYGGCIRNAYEGNLICTSVTCQ